ncbi:hypothetical protein [Mucilaginibacter gilvus]|uniref:Uncharacterized protein n=1 Tax=Mucilaginibacter gilvus TaxID=2305909 RepID=A0A3S3V8I0_9SPHI|nr:hypothetical protein [Mucilaginibacter gilvus]RWY47939.1 hypothetical protein EPL05_20315 [Mucilaginibacter gilvus]
MKSDMENKEWGDDEMSLKRFTRNNPFTVPSAYFEQAGQRILSLVKLDELKSTDPANGFTVPANYFDALSANITSRTNIDVDANAEHNGFVLPANYFDALTANITSRVNIGVDAESEHNGFALPANYFDELSANITAQINIEAEDNGFAMPAGYFDELTSKIQSRINIEELAKGEEFFAVSEGYFNGMQQQITARIAVEEILEEKITGFAVPENYFEMLNRNILNKTVNKEVVIRKTIVRKLFASNTFKYATAACLALIVGTGAFLRQSGSEVVVPTVSHQKTLLHSALANVPVDEIKDYLELNVDAGDATGMIQDDKQINTKALDEDLSDYIDVN